MQSQERVQFFHSESSFGSQSSLNDSRYYDFTNQIIAETDNIFLTLMKQLIPNQNLLQQDRLKYTLTRAQLIQKVTIPEHQVYLEKIGAPQNAQQQVATAAEKLQKLLSNYEKLKDGTMIYKQFYNIYGKQFGYHQGAFSRKKDNNILEENGESVLKPEYIQINYNGDRHKLRSTPRIFVQPNANNQKDIANLREEVRQLKKQIQQNKKSYELELANQKIISEKRIRTYLNLKSSDAQIKNIKDQLQQYSQKVTETLEVIKNQQAQISKQEKYIQKLKTQNATLQEYIQKLRKTDINLQEKQDFHNKSYSSELGQKQDKKMQRRIKNLSHQNQLLKGQLKNERQMLYKIKSDLAQEERRQLQRCRRQLDKKTVQLAQLYNTFDKQRVEIIQLSHTNKLNNKINQAIKQQNQELKKMNQKYSTIQQNSRVLLNMQSQDHSLDLSRHSNSNKCSVQDYEGDGIQGVPYYDILSKQFKIRFKRACLKQKQLLYKSNGVQIGLISSFQQPNLINMLIHITNYSQNNFQRMKVKVMNANDNKITGGNMDYPNLPSNQQVKVSISLQINRYPLGPLILLLQYQSEGKKQELRILLPAHIFKMIQIEPRNQPLKNPTQIKIIGERKIAKDLNDIKQYLKGSIIDDETIKVSFYHKHTHTVLNMDVKATKDQIIIQYQHEEGNASITSYFIKTFCFLLSK